MEVTTTGDGGGGCICASCTLPIVISVCATALVSVIVCTLICCCCCKRRKSSEPARKVGEEAGAVEETERLHVCQQCGKKAWKSVADGGGSDNNAYEEDVGSTGVVSVTVVNEKSSMGDIMGDGKKATPNPYVNMPIGTQGTNASEGMKNVDNNEKHEDTHEHGDTQKLENVVKIEVTEPMKSDEHVYNESERDIEVKGGYENEITISEEVQEVQIAEHDERGIGVADHRLSSAQDYIEIEPVEGIHAQSHQSVYENLEGGGVVGVSGHKETYPQLVDEASERQDEIREGGSRADEDDAVTVKVDMRDTEVTSKLEETTEAHSEIQLVNEATERLHADRRRADELDAMKVDMPDREVITTSEEMMEERSEIQLVYGNTEILYADKSRAGEVDTVRVTVDKHDMEENPTFEVTAGKHSEIDDEQDSAGSKTLFSLEGELTEVDASCTEDDRRSSFQRVTELVQQAEERDRSVNSQEVFAKSEKENDSQEMKIKVNEDLDDRIVQATKKTSTFVMMRNVSHTGQQQRHSVVIRSDSSDLVTSEKESPSEKDMLSVDAEAPADTVIVTPSLASTSPTVSEQAVVFESYTNIDWEVGEKGAKVAVTDYQISEEVNGESGDHSSTLIQDEILDDAIYDPLDSLSESEELCLITDSGKDNSTSVYPGEDYEDIEIKYPPGSGLPRTATGTSGRAKMGDGATVVYENTAQEVDGKITKSSKKEKSKKKQKKESKKKGKKGKVEYSKSNGTETPDKEPKLKIQERPLPSIEGALGTANPEETYADIEAVDTDEYMSLNRSSIIQSDEQIYEEPVDLLKVQSVVSVSAPSANELSTTYPAAPVVNAAVLASSDDDDDDDPLYDTIDTTFIQVGKSGIRIIEKEKAEDKMTQQNGDAAATKGRPFSIKQSHDEVQKDEELVKINVAAMIGVFEDKGGKRGGIDEYRNARDITTPDGKPPLPAGRRNAGDEDSEARAIFDKTSRFAMDPGEPRKTEIARQNITWFEVDHADSADSTRISSPRSVFTPKTSKEVLIVEKHESDPAVKNFTREDGDYSESKVVNRDADAMPSKTRSVESPPIELTSPTHTLQSNIRVTKQKQREIELEKITGVSVSALIGGFDKKTDDGQIRGVHASSATVTSDSVNADRIVVSRQDSEISSARRVGQPSSFWKQTSVSYRTTDSKKSFSRPVNVVIIDKEN